MDAQPKLFKFNLLPPKPKQEVELEAERDDSVLYSFLLIFVTSVVYFALVLAQGALVDPRALQAQAAVTTRNEQLNTYSAIKSLHGELFIKTEALKPVLTKNIVPSEIFSVASELIAKDTRFHVQSYSRERSGLFVFQVVIPAFTDVPALITQAKSMTGVSDVLMRAAIINSSTGDVSVTIALNIDALRSSAQQQ